MNLLHVDASVLGDHSVSRQISAAVVARLKGANPDAVVTYRDLAQAPLDHLSGAHLAVRMQGVGAVTPGLAEDHAAGEAALAEFLAADVVVIGAPMYNFTLPSQLKAWIDRLLVAGKTFRYSAAGPEGLAGDKRVIAVLSRGNLYGAQSPNAAYEHLESYLRTVFAFIGVTDLTFVTADGIQISPEHRQAAIKGALETVAELRAA
jgi:FMN-dependent NADH-azoreductase